MFSYGVPPGRTEFPCGIGLKLLTIGTNVTTMFPVQRKIKSGLKLLLIQTEVATHACKLFKDDRAFCYCAS